MTGEMTHHRSQPYPTVSPLAEREVHVWQVSLQTSPLRLEQLRRLLTPEERQRADRYHFAKHSERFSVARGTLRVLLGRYLRKPPEAIRFAFGPHGKPRLMEVERSDEQLEFNVTHSHDLALIALCRKSPVGVDLERKDDSVDVNTLAARYFSEEEYASLQTLPEAQRRQGFYDCWTRKEAYLKACGQGLTKDITLFAVSLLPDMQARLLFDRSDMSAAARWSLYELKVPSDYVASLAVEGHGWATRQFKWLDRNYMVEDKGAAT